MIEESTFAALIGAIYDAAADPSRWSDALCLIADAYGAPAAVLGRQGKTPDKFWNMAPRIDPAFLQNYASYYHSVNPMWRRESSPPTGTVKTDSMVMPRNEFARTEFYNDFLLPQGIDTMLNAVVSLEGGRHTVVTVQGRRAFEPEHIRLHKRLAPHLERAVQLNIKLATLEGNHAASVEALNQLDQGALLVDASAGVVFANRAAEGLFAAGRGLRLGGGILRANVPVETTRLHARVAGGAQGGAGSGRGRQPLLVERAGQDVALAARRAAALRTAVLDDRPSGRNHLRYRSRSQGQAADDADQGSIRSDNPGNGVRRGDPER